MVNQDIVNYIKQARAAGDSDENIKSGLSSAGWDAKDINDAFAEISGAPAQPSQPQTSATGQPSAQSTSAGPTEPVDSTKSGFGYYVKSAFRIAFFNGRSMEEIADNKGALIWSIVFSLPWGFIGLLIPATIIGIIAKIFKGKARIIDFFKVVSFGSIAMIIIFLPVIILFSLLAGLISSGGSIAGLIIYLGAVGIMSIWSLIVYIMMIKQVFKFGYGRAIIVMLIPYIIVGILGALIVFFVLKPMLSQVIGL